MKMVLIKRPASSLCLLVLLVLSVGAPKKSSAPAAKPAPTVTLAVDASEAPRKIFHAKLTIPASPGTLTSITRSGFPASMVRPGQSKTSLV